MNNLNKAILSQNHTIIIELIESGIDVNKAIDGQLPIVIAAYNNDIETMKLLIQHGADPKKRLIGTANAYDALGMRNEVRMGCPSPEVKTTINQLQKYYTQIKKTKTNHELLGISVIKHNEI